MENRLKEATLAVHRPLFRVGDAGCLHLRFGGGGGHVFGRGDLL